jgi:hypothetical protein
MTNNQSSLLKGVQQQYTNNIDKLNYYNNVNHQQDKVKSFRIQEEFGPKKKIKP